MQPRQQRRRIENRAGLGHLFAFPACLQTALADQLLGKSPVRLDRGEHTLDFIEALTASCETHRTIVIQRQHQFFAALECQALPQSRWKHETSAIAKMEDIALLWDRDACVGHVQDAPLTRTLTPPARCAVSGKWSRYRPAGW
jgi:hypothetical protein